MRKNDGLADITHCSMKKDCGDAPHASTEVWWAAIPEAGKL